MAERGDEAAVVTGSNLLYLSSGPPGEMFGLLPTHDDEAFIGVLAWRYLAAIPTRVILEAQNWVTDIRAGCDASQ